MCISSMQQIYPIRFISARHSKCKLATLHVKSFSSLTDMHSDCLILRLSVLVEVTLE